MTPPPVPVAVVDLRHRGFSFCSSLTFHWLFTDFSLSTLTLKTNLRSFSTVRWSVVFFKSGRTTTWPELWPRTDGQHRENNITCFREFWLVRRRLLTSFPAHWNWTRENLNSSSDFWVCCFDSVELQPFSLEPEFVVGLSFSLTFVQLKTNKHSTFKNPSWN